MWMNKGESNKQKAIKISMSNCSPEPWIALVKFFLMHTGICFLSRKQKPSGQLYLIDNNTLSISSGEAE